MRNTEVLTVRVEQGNKQRFADFCERIGASGREIIENILNDYYDGKIRFDGGHIVAEAEVYTTTDEDIDYHALGLDTFVQLLRKREYPDEYIKRFVDNMISSAYDMPKFNPRRMRQDDGGC